MTTSQAPSDDDRARGTVVRRFRELMAEPKALRAEVDAAIDASLREVQKWPTDPVEQELRAAAWLCRAAVVDLRFRFGV